MKDEATEEVRDEPVPSDPAIRKPSAITPTCDCFVNKGMTFNRQMGMWFCSSCGAYEDYTNKTLHYQRVEEFMVLANQANPSQPELPTLSVRLLRCKLIIEEVRELVNALGFDCVICDPYERNDCTSPSFQLVEIADGCADLSVVTIGTLIACGISDKPILEAVDENNLAKFKPRCPVDNDILERRMNDKDQHYDWQCPTCIGNYSLEIGGYQNSFGKWVKGKLHRKVELEPIIQKMRK